MNKRERADEFVRFVGLELKGAITARGHHASKVAKEMGRSVTAFSNWLNGKTPIPMSVLCEACEVIGVNPTYIVDTAYNRLAVAYGAPGDSKSRHSKEAIDAAMSSDSQIKKL